MSSNNIDPDDGAADEDSFRTLVKDAIEKVTGISDSDDSDSGTADETASDRRQECPECGGDVYYEPWLHGGTEYEFRNGYCSGWACQDCSWTDPEKSSKEDRHGKVECPRDDCDNMAGKWQVEENGKCDRCRRRDAHKKRARDRREAQAAE